MKKQIFGNLNKLIEIGQKKKNVPPAFQIFFNFFLACFTPPDFLLQGRSRRDSPKKKLDPDPTVMDPTNQGSSNHKKDSDDGS